MHDTFIAIRDYVLKYGNEIKHDDFITVFQHGLVQVARKQDKVQSELFILFGLALTVSCLEKETALTFHGGDERGLLAIVNYLPLLNCQPVS